jgi:hypothetical protein
MQNHALALPADLREIAGKLGLAADVIYLPRTGIDLACWPVVACDQFTAEPEYWQETEAIVGDRPSTLHLILPEFYLENPGSLPLCERISRINRHMHQYLLDGTLEPLPAGWILVDRATARHPSRKGLVLAVDLERYEFQPGNQQMIRATEGTVLDRIPPRLRIRQDASLELPHVQLLIDDPSRSVIEPMYAALQQERPLYETGLIQGGGSIRSWLVPADSALCRQAILALSQLASIQQLGLLAVVGDGNHSLATAKAHWEIQRQTCGPDHPSRYALVELINIHDEGLAFEPIHRVLFDIAPDDFLTEAKLWFSNQDLQIESPGQDSGGLPDDCGHDSSGADPAQTIPLFWRDKSWLLRIGKPVHSLTAGSLQPFLDSLARHRQIRVDYIHGDEVVRRLASAGAIGLCLPALDKNTFFQTITREGVLPRKTFSMGEAREKRYYFESRLII